MNKIELPKIEKLNDMFNTVKAIQDKFPSIGEISYNQSSMGKLEETMNKVVNVMGDVTAKTVENVNKLTGNATKDTKSQIDNSASLKESIDIMNRQMLLMYTVMTDIKEVLKGTLSTKVSNTVNVLPIETKVNINGTRNSG